MISNFVSKIKFFSLGYRYEKKQKILKKLNNFSKNIVSKINKDKNKKISYFSFGKKNKNKKFYIIQRNSFNTGFFSNFTYVLNHLLIAKKKKFIPVIDMENFPNLYNEITKVNNTYNSWEYYFERVSKYKLKEVYKSKNVFFSSGKFLKNFIINSGNLKFEPVIKNFIKVNSFIKKEEEKFYLKNFKNNTILGVLFRGQEQKYSPGHFLPPNIKQIEFKIKKYLKKYNIDKIFLVTEEQKYLDVLKKKYPKKIIYFNSLRSYNTNRYYSYNRRNHRYLLGKEILIEMLLLSKCNYVIGSNTNVIETAKLFSLINKNNTKFDYINNGINSKNPLVRRWIWDLKNILPYSLGGFKIK